MSRQKWIVSLIAVLAALALIACAGTQEEKKKPRKVLKPMKAKVTSAAKMGTDGGHPIIEVSGSLPGTGWTPELEVDKSSGEAKVRIMAIPGPGATKGADVPFTQKFVIKEASGVIHVLDHRGVEIKRLE